MAVETLPPDSKQATPVIDENGKPVPGLFVFEVLHPDPAIEAEIKELLSRDKEDDLNIPL